MAARRAASIIAISLLGIPLTYMANTAQTLYGEVGLFVVGTGIMVGLSYLTYLAVRRKDGKTDPLYYSMHQRLLYNYVTFCRCWGSGRFDRDGHFVETLLIVLKKNSFTLNQEYMNNSIPYKKFLLSKFFYFLEVSPYMYSVKSLT